MSKPAVKIMLAAAGLLAGCTPPKGDPTPGPVVTPPPSVENHTGGKTTVMPSTMPADPVIATVGTTRITHSELSKPLFEAYGFNMLMLVIQRDMARDLAAQQNIKVTPEDIKWEYNWTVEKMFPNLNPTDDREKLLDQFLAQPKPKDQTTTRTELGIIIETNAYLRKVVEPKISTNVTDEMLQKQFDESYGAQVQVRHIVTDNPQDAAAVQRRLAAGEDFATVARQVSRDPQTRRLGGELPPFTINNTRFPENFRRVAFDLKPGQVSDPVQAAGGYHLIKLEKRIAPKAVKFEDVKQSVREDYIAGTVQQAVAGVRAQAGAGSAGATPHRRPGTQGGV
ncbi:MAG: peptidylprolyl isomerase [Tepidisphaeraceae bacterium]